MHTNVCESTETSYVNGAGRFASFIDVCTKLTQDEAILTAATRIR